MEGLLKMNKYLESIKNDDLPIIQYNSLCSLNFIKHGFTTRLGGVSEGIFSSLNLSFSRGDEKEAVLTNYRRIEKKIGYKIEDFVASHQTHTTNIRIVSDKDKGKGIIKPQDYEEVDGLMTDEKDIVLFTYYADCVPLYFVDTVKKVIALSHSGRMGTVKRMGAKTIEKMISVYGSKTEDIICAIGPSICKDCYEVGEEVAEEFKREFDVQEVKDFLEYKQNGKYQLDLWRANEIILLNAGIKKENIENRQICTCCNEDILFSHRASKGKRGNLAAFMVICD